MTVAVTGSNGFVGKHLINELKNLKYNVIEIDISNGIDLTSETIFEIVPKFDILVHLAGKSFIPDAFEYPNIFFRINYITTLNSLELAKKFNAKVIFFSTYVYGNPMYLPIDEKHPINPLNPYTESKYISERLCESYNRDFNIPITIFRPFNIYGKGQANYFLIPTIFEQYKNNTKIILKDPRPKRDFIHISDIVDAIILEVQKQFEGFNIFNLGSGKSYSIGEIIVYINNMFGNDKKIEFTNEFRKGEILNTVADISKANKLLMWEPKISIEQGLKLCI